MTEMLKKEEVDELLRCKNCREVYLEPLIVPCFKKICIDCVKKHTVNGKLNCCFCKQTHEIPLNGFPIDEDLNELIKKKFEKIYQNKHIKQLDEIVQQLETFANTLECKEKGLENDLTEYCRSIRIKIDLATEEAIERINKIRDNYVLIINDYENENLKNIKTTSDTIHYYKLEINEYITELKQFVSDRNIEEEKSKEIYEKACIKKNEIDERVKMVDLLKFNGKKIDFIKNDYQTNEKLLGKIEFLLITIPSKLKLKNFLCQKNLEKKTDEIIVSASSDRISKQWNIEKSQQMEQASKLQCNACCSLNTPNDTKCPSCKTARDGHTASLFSNTFSLPSLSTQLSNSSSSTSQTTLNANGLKFNFGSSSNSFQPAASSTISALSSSQAQIKPTFNETPYFNFTQNNFMPNINFTNPWSN